MKNNRFLIPAILILSASVGELNAQVTDSGVDVLFDIGSHIITPNADSTLSLFFLELKSEGDIFTLNDRDYTQGKIDHVKIVAHTDATGNLRYNELLSKRRAEAVRDWMFNNQLDTTNCLLAWRGEVDSLVSNRSAELRKLNRRAQVKVFANAYIVLPMNLIEGTVLDSNDAGIDAQIIVRGKHFLDSTYTDSTGYFSLLAPDTSVYSMDVLAKGYVYESRMFKNDHQRNVALNFNPTPLHKGVKFQLHRFYFVGNQAVLLKTSEPELVRLMRFMTLNPTTIISIEGHINYPNNARVSKDSKLFDLSERRAKLVYEYLVEKKINPKRLSYEGFGNWNMVYPNGRSEEMQSKNRRVEIRIVEQ